MKPDPSTWTKHYTDPRRCAEARANHAWLEHLGSGVRLPALRAHGSRHLDFEHLGHNQPGPEHLNTLADALGRLHAAAHRALHDAVLDKPFRTGHHVIADFVTPRRAVLQAVEIPVSQTPSAVYKDANIRNFLLTDDGPAIVDFDDLTLAPFGYDLAKLVVTTAMTHGPTTEEAVLAALDAYNRQTSQGSPDVTCSYSMHALLLTRPPSGRGVPQRDAGCELGHAFGGDLDFRSRLRIPSGPGLPLDGREGPKAN
jgi:hypothetical protein